MFALSVSCVSFWLITYTVKESIYRIQEHFWWLSSTFWVWLWYIIRVILYATDCKINMLITEIRSLLKCMAKCLTICMMLELNCRYIWISFATFLNLMSPNTDYVFKVGNDNDGSSKEYSRSLLHVLWFLKGVIFYVILIRSNCPNLSKKNQALLITNRCYGETSSSDLASVLKLRSELCQANVCYRPHVFWVVCVSLL